MEFHKHVHNLGSTRLKAIGIPGGSWTWVQKPEVHEVQLLRFHVEIKVIAQDLSLGP